MCWEGNSESEVTSLNKMVGRNAALYPLFVKLRITEPTNSALDGQETIV